MKICTTPPTASLPYRAEAGPLRISMRSIMSTGMVSQLGLPVVAEPKRTPSINSTVWRASAPRMLTLLFLPNPPLALNWTPGARPRISASVRPVDFSMSARLMTTTSLTNSSVRWLVRDAVTTVPASWAGVCAQTGRLVKTRETGESSTARRARPLKVTWVFMGSTINNSAFHRPPRQCMSVTDRPF